MPVSFNGKTSCLFLLCLLSVPVGQVLAGNTALEHVLISRSDGLATLEIRFTCQHRYIDHSPIAPTTRARINIVRVEQCGLGLASAPRREVRRPSGRQLAGLKELEFLRGGGGEGVLELRFDQPVIVAVRQGAGLLSLVVTVEMSDAEITESEMVVVPPPLPGQSDPSRSLERTPERIRIAKEKARRSLARQSAEAAVKAEAKGFYTINLESSNKPIEISSELMDRFSGDHELYITELQLDGAKWHRLRLGFFDTEAQAEAAVAPLRHYYSDAWVARVSSGEHVMAAENAIMIRSAPADESPELTKDGAMAPRVALDSAMLETLMDEGRSAMLADDYSRAIQIYTKVLAGPEHPYSQQAQEYLALARERNGQNAHAIAEYRRYLMLYPEGDDANRVSQRLAGLVGFREEDDAFVRSSSESRRETNRWEVYGGISQYYRRDVNQFDDQDEIVSQSSVLSDFDVMARRRGDRFDFSSRATIGNLYDLLSDDEGPGNDSRIYYLYADLVDAQSDLSARVGRQSLHTSGVLGRFDGAQLSWQWRPDIQLSVVSGFPVDSSEDSIQTDRQFYGLSVDFTQLWDLFDTSIFYNTQDVDDIGDREALGGEIRYFDDSLSVIGLIDYDLSYSEINSFVLLGNWAFENRITLNAMVDMRKSPYLTTRNALIGQPVTNIEGLLSIYNEDEIRELAQDRTGDLQTYIVGISAPLFERFQINADITMSSYDGTSASASVPETPDFGTEFYYSVYLIGNSLLKEGDTSIFAVRYADGSTVSTTTLSADTRYPLTRKVRINPRILISYREAELYESKQWIAAPALRLLYMLSRRYRLELEVGGEWSDQKLAEGSSDYSAYFIYAGYRADF
jgi:tetratricopeptide (TPR) repeat protein